MVDALAAGMLGGMLLLFVVSVCWWAAQVQRIRQQQERMDTFVQRQERICWMCEEVPAEPGHAECAPCRVIYKKMTRKVAS